MRKWLIIPGVLILVLGVFAWRLPAGLLLDPAQSRLPGMDWSDSEGTAWNGQIEGFTWRGLQLGTVHWKFAGLEDLDTRLTRWELHSFSPQHNVRGQVSLTPRGEIRQVQGLTGYLPAAWIDVTDRLPLIYLDGSIELDLQHLQLDQHLPVDGEGSITWKQAAITGGASEQFGTLQLKLDPREANSSAGIVFNLQSLDPADIRMRGEGSMLRNDYEIDLRLDVSMEREDLVGFMQQLGGEITPGKYRYRWRGNLR